MTTHDQEFLGRVRATTRATLADVIGEGVPVALLDVPNQRNVGDAMILAGELAYLRALGARVAYAADMRAFDPRALRRAMPRGVVLLHGGGNLGDVWPGHQRHREEAIAALHDYRVVQLPQSVFFREPEAAARFAEVARAHPDLHLLLRDTATQQRVDDQLPGLRASFCHDMALGFSPAPAPPPDRRGTATLVLARRDHEQSVDLAALTTAALDHEPVVEDWAPRGRRAVAWRAARAAAQALLAAQRASGLAALPRLRWPVVRGISTVSVAGGVDLLGDARLVVTDRLHAHVLAGLLGVDHVVMDNSYGKVGAIYRDYTHGFSTARFATDEVELRDALAELVPA